MGRFAVCTVLALAIGCTSGRNGPPPGGDAGPMRRCDSMQDTDGDGIWDEIEGGETIDSDGDGTPDYRDLDSDDDGISDQEEGGAGGCSARNSDGTDTADYIDNDSDNDGLSDREERERYFTDPYDPDSDDDGFDDTSEVATRHDPNDPADGLDPEDFYLVLPYNGEPQVRELTFNTDLRKADVFFQMDRTGSMSGEVSSLKAGLSTLISRIATTIPDVGVGFGGFEDFDVRGGSCTTVLGMEVCDVQYAAEGDVPFELLSVITTDTAQMMADVNLLRADGGGATWASSAEALYQTATGAGIGPWVPPQSCPTIPDENGSRYGYPCFRPGALPIIVTMTDTSSRNGPLTSADQNYDTSYFPAGVVPHTYDQTVNALATIGARTFGIVSGAEVSSPTPMSQFLEWARMTGTVDASGAPIAFTINSDGTGLTDRIAEAIEQLALETPQDIGTRTADGEDIPVMDPPVDATLMIKAITPKSARDGVREVGPEEVARDDRTFYSVPPGTVVSFDVTFLNDVVPGGRTALVFLAKIVVVGNGVADLDEREVVIVVPADSSPLI